MRQHERHSSATAISTPETGVHKPSSNSTAKHAAATSRVPKVMPRSEEAPSAVLQSPVEQPESLLPLALTRVRFPANPPEMSQKAVAIVIPFIGYLHR
jgi:hypothetical protein